MARTDVSTDVKAAPSDVYDLLSNTTRIPEWNVSYDTPHVLSDHESEPGTFDVHRILANRSMRFVCRPIRNEPAKEFAFECHGEEGELARESFTLSRDPKTGETKLRWASEFTLSGEFDPLKEVSELTYTQAWIGTTAEQSVARLRNLLESRETDAKASVDMADQPEAH